MISSPFPESLSEKFRERKCSFIFFFFHLNLGYTPLSLFHTADLQLFYSCVVPKLILQDWSLKAFELGAFCDTSFHIHKVFICPCVVPSLV